ncbi:peptidylprolyl isomerase%2C FKBP-type [Vibrio cholerae]|nr:peptidylprolyl isomerase%2C FKBP-type [Vibrio cholerae]
MLAGFMIYRTWTNHKSADANFSQYAIGIERQA